MAQKQSAKDYAKEQLGNLDLSYLDNERNVANNTYNTTKSSLETNFNNLVDQINSNRADTSKNFNTGRSTIAEDAYNANRLNQTDLAARGIGSSGLKQLGELGNRMETGQQYSNLANKYYNTMNELDTTEKQGRSQYDIDLQNAKNTLDNALAGIDTRKGEATNNYNMTLGQLAEQVQSRWDSNENAKKQLEMQKKQLAQAKAAAAQAHSDAVKSAKAQLKQTSINTLNDIIQNNRNNVGNMITAVATQFNVSTKVAENALAKIGLTGRPLNNYTINDAYKDLGII